MSKYPESAAIVAGIDYAPYIKEALFELEKATDEHPDFHPTFTGQALVLAEEAGEVCQAVLQWEQEGSSLGRIEDELAHVVAVGLRMMHTAATERKRIGSPLTSASFESILLDLTDHVEDTLKQPTEIARKVAMGIADRTYRRVMDAYNNMLELYQQTLKAPIIIGAVDPASVPTNMELKHSANENKYPADGLGGDVANALRMAKNPQRFQKVLELMAAQIAREGFANVLVVKLYKADVDRLIGWRNEIQLPISQLSPGSAITVDVNGVSFLFKQIGGAFTQEPIFSSVGAATVDDVRKKMRAECERRAYAALEGSSNGKALLEKLIPVSKDMTASQLGQNLEVWAPFNMCQKAREMASQLGTENQVPDAGHPVRLSVYGIEYQFHVSLPF